MTTKNIVVYGIFPTREAAESCVGMLRAADFRNNDVSLLLPNSSSMKEFAHQKATKAPEGTVVGAGAGVVLGGALGWLAGVGSLAIPAVGPLIAAGPIMGLLAGAGVGGSVGGLTGGLVGMGMPEYEAKRFEGIVTNGGILLSVHCDNKDWAKKAKSLLQTAGATDISTTTEASSQIKVDEHDQLISKAS